MFVRLPSNIGGRIMSPTIPNTNRSAHETVSVPIAFRLAGMISRSGVRGADRLAAIVLRVIRVPAGYVQGTFYGGVRFRVRPSEDGSFFSMVLLAGGAPVLAPVFEAALGAGDLAIDVGANTGIYTAVAASLVGPAGRVLAFEPHPFARRALLDLVEANTFQQVSVLPLAVSASHGRLRLHVTRGASGLTSAYPPANATEVLEVESVPLDSVVGAAGHALPRLLKIDVEGFEFEVLRGAAGLLGAKEAPLVIFESDASFGPSRSTFAEMRSWLAQRGYSLFGLTPSGARLVPSDAPEPLSQNTVAARPTEHERTLSRLGRVRFRRNQNS
jgi:FkbM family methyltransferase